MIVLGVPHTDAIIYDDDDNDDNDNDDDNDDEYM